MTEPQKNKVKQSFIAGSLTSSAGVFLSKLIGLFYVVPFKSIAGQSNMAFYSAAYTWYNVLLQISSAGLPFAVAAIVAKYVNKNDFKTVVLVRKLSTALLMVFGFVMAVIFILMSGPLAVSAMGSLSEQNIRQMQNMVERFKIINDNGRITSDSLPEEVRRHASENENKFSKITTMEEMEQEYINYVISVCDGSITKAARILGLSRATIYKYKKDQ